MPPPGLVLKRKLNKHAVGTKHIRNNYSYNANNRLSAPLPINLARFNAFVPPSRENYRHPVQEDFGGEGAYDDFDEIVEGEEEDVDEEMDGSGSDTDKGKDDGEHLGDREEPVDDDDTNLADLMAQNSLDDEFCVLDLTKDNSGKYRDQEIEPILPKVLIMVRESFYFWIGISL
jgi:hypothetical protein